VRVWGGKYREELKLNVTVFVVRVREQYGEELLLNVTVFFVRVWGGKSREELILNVTVFSTNYLHQRMHFLLNLKYYNLYLSISFT
jgi:glycine cleavage system protein P-like pyridoxal-binding family